MSNQRFFRHAPIGQCVGRHAQLYGCRILLECCIGPRALVEVNVRLKPEPRLTNVVARLRPYALAGALVAAAYLVRWALESILGTRSPFLLFVLPVLAAVISSGRLAGLLAGALSLAAGLSFEPQDSWGSPALLVQAGIFIGVCLGVGLLGERLTIQRRAAQQAQHAAEAEAARAWTSERALEGRERQLESILSTVPDAMVVIDASGSIISFSPAAEKTFGYSEGEAITRNVSMLMPSPDREEHDSYIRKYLETRVPKVIGSGRVVSGVRADGTVFPMKLSVGEAEVDGERIFTGFIQDLTETRKFEADLEQLRSELIHASRLSAMGTMAATLAHEVNQPLTAICNYGDAANDLLQEPGDVDRQTLKQAVSGMAEQARRAGNIIRRLRDFVARREVNKTVEDLPKLITEASSLALVGSRQKGIEIHYHFGIGATPVLVDRIQIEQVLVNLIRNAVEAMANSETRQLSIDTKLLDAEMIEICVRDTGPGIAPEVAGRLFKAFSTTKTTGMGLGLSICRTIIETHGGSIGARPIPGGGTEFAFTIPLAIVPNAEAGIAPGRSIRPLNVRIGPETDVGFPLNEG